MVNTSQAEFVERAHIYVTNRGYPSIHLYTVDKILIDYMIFRFNARCVPHIGTTDVVITKVPDLAKAAGVLYTYGTKEQRLLAAALLKYCGKTDRTSKLRVAKRLKRLLSIASATSG